MRRYDISIEGTTPLLMHWDNIDWADMMKAWQNDAKNRAGSAAGDDRTPAWRWIGSLYHDNKVVAMPSDNIMSCLMQAGTMITVPGGKGGKTFKSQSQSGMMSGDAYWQLTTDGRTVSMTDINALMKVEDFKQHKDVAASLGFALFVKRARIGQSKHIRVRPRFDRWELTGSLIVSDKQITDGVLQEILTYAGRYKGLGDWRPGAKTPGPFGTFSASVKAV